MQSDVRIMDGTKLMYHRELVEDYFLRGKRVAPAHIDMGLSKSCQIRCKFCYGIFQNMSRAYIQRGALLQLVKDASDIGVLSIAAIGDGEPLMNPHAFEFFSFARDYTKIDMAISTNGVALNSEGKCDIILSSCKWMRFCICAGTREGYIKIHQRDFFDKVVMNIKKLISIKNTFGYRCDVGLQAVYIPGVMDQEMIELSKLSLNLGVNFLVIKQCSLPDEGQSGMDFFDLNAYDSQKTKDTLDICESMTTPQTQIIAKRNTMMRKGKREYNGCLSVPFLSEFSGDGSWYPCGYFFGNKPEFMRYRFGNVHEKSLKAIWESEHYWNIINTMKTFNVHKDCKGACRLDCTNKFCYDYVNGKIKWPDSVPYDVKGVNFV